MASKAGISGIAVALAAGGGVLAYAGFKGYSLVEALKAISSKSGPPGVTNTSADLSTIIATPITASVVAGVEGVVGGAVTSAAGPYMADKYSQTKRRDKGWSDCSSFVYKILRDMGRPPTVAWSNTTNYHMDPRFKTVPTAQAQAADLALSAGHVMILTGAGGPNAPAIGQQNTHENVRTGTLAQYMPKPYVIKRYVGPIQSMPAQARI